MSTNFLHQTLFPEKLIVYHEKYLLIDCSWISPYFWFLQGLLQWHLHRAFLLFRTLHTMLCPLLSLPFPFIHYSPCAYSGLLSFSPFLFSAFCFALISHTISATCLLIFCTSLFIRPILSSRFFRSSRPDVFCKKGVPINFAKFTGKHLYLSLFFSKVGLQLY